MTYPHLNPEQQRAVLTTKGRVLILAGAGSGKTSTLAYRMAYLIEHEHISPSAILGLTFTNKAAQEMQERIAKIVSKETAKNITLCTFHSFCMQVLRTHIERLGYTKRFSLYDDKDMKRLTTQLTRSLLEHEGKLPSLNATLALLQERQQKGEEDEKKLPTYESEWQKKFIQELHYNLEVSLRAYNAVDFDSLISLSVKLFQTHPDILEYYQNRYQYIMIDEYQDTNPQQYLLASLLSSQHHNLCVVGDDDQSIYGWRGAEVKHILQFKYDTLIKLEQNYRSSKKILYAANAVIKNNLERHPKTLWSQKNSDYPLVIFHAPSEQEEAETVVNKIIALRSEHDYAWKDFAILYRSNQLSRAFEVALMQAHVKTEKGWTRGIPYEVFGGLELYERSEIKDLMAYLKVIANPKDQEALLRIINYPRRGISETTLDLLTTYNRSSKISLWDLLKEVVADADHCQELIHSLPQKAYQQIKAFMILMETTREQFAQQPLHLALSSLVEAIDYKTAISDEVKSEKMQSFKWENVQECIHLLQSYEEEMGSQASLDDFLATTLLDSQKISRKSGPTYDHVNLLTFHSAKGLEFPICFLVGLEDHLIPHEKSLMETGLEEERRLMYVALTRCKEQLFLSMARTRKKHGKDIQSSPSRFLFEIPQELLDIVAWKEI
jgi:DNA helicase II / ATP-dependent DNA helicase PcrA